MSKKKIPSSTTEQEQQLQSWYQSEQNDTDVDQWSQETTSAELDASILAMAQAEVDNAERTSEESESESAVSEEQPNPSQSSRWLQRFKYPVSVAAALVMTVGVSRLMVHLSEQPMSVEQSLEVADVAYSNEVVVEPPATSMPPSKYRQAAEEKKALRAKVEREALETERRARQIQQQRGAEKERLARLREQEQMALTLQEAESDLAKSIEPQNVAAPVVAAVDAEQEEVVVTGSRLKSNNTSLEVSGHEFDGVLDEAVLGYPLPEVWVEQIEQLLQQGDEISALDEWGQFRRTYPEYDVEQKVSKKLLEQIKSLQNLGENK